MDNQAFEDIIHSKRYEPEKPARWKYYTGIGIFVLLTGLVVLAIVLETMDSYRGFPFHTLWYLLIPGIFIFIAVMEDRSYDLKTLNTDYLKEENYALVKDALKRLEWKVIIDSHNFIGAITSCDGLRTQEQERFFVFITDNRILFNCLRRLGNKQAGGDMGDTTLGIGGQGKLNKRKFLKAFKKAEIGL